MTTRICIYGCNTVLDKWDDEQRKYIEADTGTLHTRERCEAAKQSKRAAQGEKNNHGNEQSTGQKQEATTTKQAGYMDHTAKGASKCKIFFGSQPDIVTEEYNDFLARAKDKIRTQGAHDHVTQVGDDTLFSIFLYYEEVPQ